MVESSALLKRRSPKGYRGFESLPHRFVSLAVLSVCEGKIISNRARAIRRATRQSTSQHRKLSRFFTPGRAGLPTGDTRRRRRPVLREPVGKFICIAELDPPRIEFRDKHNLLCRETDVLSSHSSNPAVAGDCGMDNSWRNLLPGDLRGRKSFIRYLIR